MGLLRTFLCVSMCGCMLSFLLGRCLGEAFVGHMAVFSSFRFVLRSAEGFFPSFGEQGQYGCSLSSLGRGS